MKVLVIFAFSLAISTCSVMPRVRLNHQLQEIRQILKPRPGGDDRNALENSQLRRLIGSNYKEKDNVFIDALSASIKTPENLYRKDYSNSDESIEIKGPTYVKIINVKPTKNDYNNKYINLETVYKRLLKKKIKKKIKHRKVKNSHQYLSNKYTYNKRREHSDESEEIFDENGMIYLSQPLLDEDRKLNKLLNKVVNYELFDKKDKYLRRPLSKVFDKEELKRLDKIANGITGVDEPSSPRTVFDFSDLVA